MNFFAVLAKELQAFVMLGKHYTTKSHHQRTF